MKPRCLLSAVGIVLLAIPVAATPRPNVLFVAVDDLRPDLGCYGHPVVKSPNIDRIAAEGMRFDHAYCQQAVCLPSRSSLLSGARPDSTRAYNLTTDFRKALPDIVTLPQLFKNHGYHAEAMGKIYHHGFDDEVSWSRPTVHPAASFGVGNRDLHEDWPKTPLSKKGRGPAAEAIEGPDNCLHDGQLAEMAVDRLRVLGKEGKPFFLAVGFIRPHLPFNAPKKYWDLYQRDQIPLAPNPFRPKGATKWSFPPGFETNSYADTPKSLPYPDDHARFLRHGYYASISYVDAQIGLLLKELDRLDLRKNTIIVLWGDHGWKLGEHNAWAKHTNFEDDTRVPVILAAPGMVQAGKTSSRFVELVDIYPTLAELAGLPVPAHVEGSSFKPLLDAPERPWKAAAFSQYPRENRMGYSIRTEKFRFTRWVGRNHPEKVDAIELYDHQTDPQENVNVASQPAYSKAVKQLGQQLDAGWKAAKPKSPTP